MAVDLIEKDLRDVLKKCRTKAKHGADMADAYQMYLAQTLTQASRQIEETIAGMQNSKCYLPEAIVFFQQQLEEINKYLSNLNDSVTKDLKNQKKNIAKLTITVFGKTMAGKSTLMEVLTHGDGSSIGKGAQRTTRDIRDYVWNGLTVKDVPGIGAFEGQEDEDLALEAAKSADLILYLITTDSPQKVDAEWLARVVALGKPVICVVNVKVAVSEKIPARIALAEIEKGFDTESICGIKRQFLEYAEQFGQDWHQIPFVFTHIKSAYIAERAEDPDVAKDFYQASHFNELIEEIEKQIINRGEFYRIKTFLDIISVPILESEETLLQDSQKSQTQITVISEKKQELKKWKSGFKRDGLQAIESYIKKLEGELSLEIAEFAEEHVSDENATAAWNSFQKELKIDLKAQDLIEKLEKQCNDNILELLREVQEEVAFTAHLSGVNDLEAHRIYDDKKIFEWGTRILETGLTILGFILEEEAAKYLIIAGVGLFVIQSLGEIILKNKEEKESEIRRNIEKELKKHVKNTCTSLQKQMKTAFEDRICKKIDYLVADFDEIEKLGNELVKNQLDIGWKLNLQLLKLNKVIFSNSCSMYDVDINIDDGIKVGRVPGNIIGIVREGKTQCKKNDLLKSQTLFTESINIFDAATPKAIIGWDYESRTRNKGLHIMSSGEDIVVEADSFPSFVLNRMRIAQQVCGKLVKKGGEANA